MSTGDLIGDIDLILNSDPEGLARVANQWQELASAVRAEVMPATRALDAVAAGWESQRYPMIVYKGQAEGGLNALATGAEQVAAGLRDVAPRLANLRGELWKALAVLGLSVVGAGVVGGAALVARAAVQAGRTLVASAARGAGGVVGTTSIAADILGVADYVKAYYNEMAALSTALTAAEGEFQKLARLNEPGAHGGGGIIPAPPRLPATPN